MKYGLSDKQLQEIAGIISSYSQIEQALIFGSRAIDTYKEASDVDIAIKGSKADSKLAAALKDQLEEETYLPFFFDVIAYHSVQSEELKKHIRTKGKSIYRKSLEGWREVKFSDFVQINPQVKLQIGQEYSFVEMKDLNENQKKAYSTQIRKLKGGSKFINDDTLFARITPCLENGKICQVNKLKNKQGFGSTEFLVFREKNSVSSSNFIYYLSRWQKVRSFAELNMSGTSGRQRVSKEAFNELVLALPPLPEQKAIAEVLSSLDDKIELLHRQNKTLEDIGQTLFRQWFIEKADTGWEKRPLDKIAEYLNGLACQKYPPKNELDKLPVLKIKELKSGFTEHSDWATSKVDEKYIIKFNDIIFSWSASLMLKIWSGQNCVLNQHLFKVTSKEYPKWFYYFWTKHHLEKFITIANSKATTMGHIKRGDLSSSLVLIPASKELSKMNEQITLVFDKIFSNQLQINTLENLRDTLLPKLMSGEVRIKHSQTIE